MGRRTGSGSGWARSAVLLVLVCAVLLLFCFLPTSWSWPATRGADFTVHIFDIGQGDSSLIECGRAQAVIDGGPSRTVLQRLGRTMPFTDRHIEYVFLTHPHDDHFFGLFAVLERYQVEQLVLTESAAANWAGRALIELATERGTAVTLADAGDLFALGNCGRLVALWPDARAVDLAQGDDNELSLTLELRRATTDEPLALFTGDIGAPTERALLASHSLQRTPLLKVAHHGSRFSSTTAFVAAVRPEYAVVSVGENRYGQPSETVLHRLNKTGTQVWRTEQDGDIVFVIQTDGSIEPHWWR